MKNNTKILSRKTCRQNGFSLIELMVACAVGFIIILAAGSTYFSTYRLKKQVSMRVEYEQDVRNAANLLRSDARQVGDYSCQTAPTPGQLNKNDFAGAFPDHKNAQSISTTLPSSISSKLTAVNNNSTPLMMVYASEELANRVISTDCGNPITGDNTLRGVVYVLGRDNSQSSSQGLYRVLLNGPNSRSLGQPQLLVDNVVSMQQSFRYDKHKADICPKGSEEGSTLSNWIDSDLTEESGNLNFDDYANPPILITTTLITCPNGIENLGAGTCTDNKPTVQYQIKSMVRQGEVCAMQTLNI